MRYFYWVYLGKEHPESRRDLEIQQNHKGLNLALVMCDYECLMLDNCLAPIRNFDKVSYQSHCQETFTRLLLRKTLYFIKMQTSNSLFIAVQSALFR